MLWNSFKLFLSETSAMGLLIFETGVLSLFSHVVGFLYWDSPT